MENTNNLMNQVNAVVSSTMTSLKVKWEKEKDYNDWLEKKVISGEIRYVVYREGKSYRAIPLLSMRISAWDYKTEKHIVIGHYGMKSIKIADAKLHRRIVRIDLQIRKLNEQIAKWKEHKENILARNYNDLKELSYTQVKHQLEKRKEIYKQFGLLP